MNFIAKPRSYFVLALALLCFGSIQAKLSDKTKKEIEKITNTLIDPQDRKTSWEKICKRYAESLRGDKACKPGSVWEKMAEAFEKCASCKKSCEIKKILAPFESALTNILCEIYGTLTAWSMDLKKKMDIFSAKRALY